MMRNLKALGLALVAAFAFSAMVASTASAQTQGHLTTEGQQNVTLTGEEIAGTVNALTAFGNEVRCPTTVYTGHKNTVTPHEFLTHGETAVTITPHYSGCVSGLGAARTVKMNGCDYELHDLTTTGGVNGTYGFTVDIICPAGKVIEVTGGPCTVNVPPQNDITGFHLTNVPNPAGKDDLRLSGTSSPFTASCGLLHTNDATQDQDVTITGHDEDKEPIDIEISD